MACRRAFSLIMTTKLCAEMIKTVFAGKWGIMIGRRTRAIHNKYRADDMVPRYCSWHAVRHVRMPRSCSICRASWKTPGISLHELPSGKNRRVWVDVITILTGGNVLPNWECTNYTVCSRHFVASDYKEGVSRGVQKKLLKPEAVPSLIGPPPKPARARRSNATPTTPTAVCR